jgi:hypothetical protein
MSILSGHNNKGSSNCPPARDDQNKTLKTSKFWVLLCCLCTGSPLMSQNPSSKPNIKGSGGATAIQAHNTKVFKLSEGADISLPGKLKFKVDQTFILVKATVFECKKADDYMIYGNLDGSNGKMLVCTKAGLGKDCYTLSKPIVSRDKKLEEITLDWVLKQGLIKLPPQMVGTRTKN